jgi:excisionase family DNA binding protein
MTDTTKPHDKNQGERLMTDTSNPNQPNAGLLYGAKAIADYLGVKRRQAEHLIETNRIPFFRIGRTVASKRSLVDAYLDRLTDGGDDSQRAA